MEKRAFRDLNGRVRAERPLRLALKIVTMSDDSSQHIRLGQSRMHSWSPSGLQTIPQLQWGSHLAHFFESGDELRDVLVPYFKAGLENNERCLWVTGKGFNSEDARSALRAVVSDLDMRERYQQIEIANGDEWYGGDKKFDPLELMSGLLRREQEALDLDYAGLRTNGNCAWVSPAQWADFQEYETLVQKGLRGRRMICMCSYCVDQVTDGSRLEVLNRHDFDVNVGTGLKTPRP